MRNISLKIKRFLPDTLLVVTVIVLSVILGALPFLLQTEGNTFTVNDGGKITEYSLSNDALIELEHATVIVENGTVRVENSDCKDKLCEEFGRISKSGESIICIPNKLSITVGGESEVDSVAN